MPSPLPTALRERCVRYVEAGNSCHAAARKFEVSPSFVIKLMRLRRESGRIEPHPRGGAPRGKLHAQRGFILAEVEKRRDITMPELRVILCAAKGTDVADATLSHFLIACGLSRKKTLHASEQDRPDVAEARREWVEARQPILSRHRRRLICVDETSTSTNMTQARGRCQKGEWLLMKNPFGHWMTETMIADLKCDGLIAPFIIPEPMNRVIFEAWVEQMLAPQLYPGDVVIMDNLPAHKSLAA